jgi:hypothetical protein
MLSHNYSTADEKDTNESLALRNGVNVSRTQTTAGERSKIDQRLNTKKALIQQDRSGNAAVKLRTNTPICAD